jgi:hypothetical protein
MLQVVMENFRKFSQPESFRKVSQVETFRVQSFLTRAMRYDGDNSPKVKNSLIPERHYVKILFDC